MRNLPRAEYPRPQFVRSAWQNLNGAWEFRIDHARHGRPDDRFDKTILVPFCPESKLSGIENRGFMESVWYRRTVTLTQEQLAGRILLHFGAVDYACTAFLNGQACGTHRGGYSSFQFDITEYVHAGENTLTVHAVDHQRDGKQPHGKQCDKYHSSGCNYTRTTGIWQTYSSPQTTAPGALPSARLLTSCRNRLPCAPPLPLTEIRAQALKRRSPPVEPSTPCR